MVDEKRLVKFYVGLTRRQREVLQLVSSGLTNDETAQQLYIASSVVAGHLTNIYAELANEEELVTARTNRYLMIRLFGNFFQRHPEFDNFVQ